MIYLHIGKAKTGSTTIQGALFTNKQKLFEQGFFYPSRGIKAQAHHNIYFELTEDAKYDSNLGGLSELSVEISGHKKTYPNSKIIISSETFEALPIEKFKYLFETLKKIDDVTVVMLLRRQDQYLLSYWSMEVKGLRVSQPFSEWAREQIVIDNDIENDFNYGLNYHYFINSLIDSVGIQNLIVRSYSELTEGDLLNNFISLLGVKSLDLNRYESLNTPLCPLGLELCRVLTKKYGSKLSPPRKKIVHDCVHLLSKRNNWIDLWYSKEHIINNDDYNFIKKEYENSNSKVSKQFPALDNYLSFGERRIENVDLSIERIPSEDLLDLAIFTLSAKQNHSKNN